MASNGLNKKAKKGTCRMCLRVRNTFSQVKPVGEVSHGYATGHIWECVDEKDCDETAERKLNSGINIVAKARIEQAKKVGRYTTYNRFG